MILQLPAQLDLGVLITSTRCEVYEAMNNIKWTASSDTNTNSTYSYEVKKMKQCRLKSVTFSYTVDTNKQYITHYSKDFYNSTSKFKNTKLYAMEKCRYTCAAFFGWLLKILNAKNRKNKIFTTFTIHRIMSKELGQCVQH